MSCRCPHRRKALGFHDVAARLDVLEVDLRQWPADEVNRHVTHWEGEIDAGRVKVIRFGSKQ